MKAAVFHQYGAPEKLQIEEVPTPTPKDSELLIKVHATTVNSADWRIRAADPWMVRLMFGLTKPKKKILGVVFSGEIKATGNKVSLFKEGDSVFGLCDQTLGAHAEYIVLPEDASIAAKPGDVSHEMAAASVFGGHTALHFLKKAKPEAGQSILIYGATGSVGSAAIQSAQHFKLKVTAVCSTEKVKTAKELGADSVLDYTTTDFNNLDEKFDIVFDTVDKLPVNTAGKLTKKKGKLILGAAMIRSSLAGILIGLRRNISVISGVASATPNEIQLLGKLLISGALTPPIDKTFALKDIRAAHTLAQSGHKKGNVMILP